MSAIHPPLLEYLACCECGGNLAEGDGRLKCTGCGKDYEVREGIPILYPKDMDLEHLREEESLAGTMRSPRLTPRRQFSRAQWDLSKQEFWSAVESRVAQPAAFVNIGCGFDSHFTRFRDPGTVFINFDMVLPMLRALQSEHGARYCVAGDIGRLPLRKGSFDCVICIDVIHHEYTKIPELLRSFQNLLKPGGYLFLEDPNAWGLYQMAKSLLLPKPLHRALRAAYHGMRRSTHKPADYEFPTSVWRTRRVLRQLGFTDIEAHPHRAYPSCSPTQHRFYQALGQSEWIRRYHNYHYLLSARNGLGSRP